MSKKLLSKRGFIRWLKSLSPNKRIKTGCASNCPIAECLLSRGIIYDIAGDSGIRFQSKEDQYQYDRAMSGHPIESDLENRSIEMNVADDWANTFVAKVDDLGHEKGTNLVSPKECLKIMEDIGNDL